MKIHSDTLTTADLWRELPDGCYLEATTHGSRSRARAFDVALSADHGADAHGLKRVYARNTGQYGGEGIDTPRAATWVEWGDWMVALFKIDPAAKIGHYDGAAAFVANTTHIAPSRPARERATEHAARWAGELGGVTAELEPA